MAKIKFLITGQEKVSQGDLFQETPELMPWEDELGGLDITPAAGADMARAMLPHVYEGSFVEMKVLNKDKDRWETKFKAKGKSSVLPNQAEAASKDPKEAGRKVVHIPNDKGHGKGSHSHEKLN